MTSEELLDALKATRKDYASELVWHRFLLDAYTGTGGFEGKVKQPQRAFLGWAAEVYSDQAMTQYGAQVGANCDTYLDRYPREDQKKYDARKNVATYLNYVEAILDTLVSYILKTEMQREKLPDSVKKWQENAGGKGVTWESLLDEIVIPRAALLGWTPVMFDMPRAPQLAPGSPGLTRAQSDKAGIIPKAIPLFPANLLSWQLDDDGAFRWAKVRVCYTTQPDPLRAPVKEDHYLIWHPTHCDKYVVVTAEDKTERIVSQEKVPHTFGVVPIVIWRQKPNPEDTVYGLGFVDGVAKVVRRLFNLQSELDEHLRSSVFAMLQVPVPANGSPPSELVAGSSNALLLPHGSSHQYEWIAPPESVAGTYETRITNTVREIYRLARDEYDDESAVAESGVARAYKFEKTNRKIGDFATQLAKAEKRAYAVVGVAMGVSSESLDQVAVIPPDNFRVEDLESDMKNALDAVSLGLPPTAQRLLKRRVTLKLIPNLSRDEIAVIDAELEDEQKAAEQAEQERREMESAAAQREIDGEPDPNDDAGEGIPPGLAPGKKPGEKKKPPRKRTKKLAA
jgi:hypothetical protein